MKLSVWYHSMLLYVRGMFRMASFGDEGGSDGSVLWHRIVWVDGLEMSASWKPVGVVDSLVGHG